MTHVRLHTWRAVLVVSLLSLSSACPDDPEPDPEETPEPFEFAEATIGPGGGELELSDGVKLVIPEGALAEDVVVRLEHTAPIPTGPSGAGMEDTTHRRAGTPFFVTPGITSFTEPLELHVLGGEDLRLIASGPGKQEPEPEPEEEELVHIPRAPRRTDGDRAVFVFPTLDGTVWQPMVRLPQAAELRRTARGGPDPTEWPAWRCSDALAEWPFQDPTEQDAIYAMNENLPAIDWLIELEVDFTDTVVQEVVVSGDGVLVAAEEFIQRSCLALWRSYAYYVDVLGLPPRLFEDVLTLQFLWRSSPSNSAEAPSFGAASQWGLRLYFNPGNIAGYAGRWTVPQNTRAWPMVWNSTPTGLIDAHADSLEKTIAHELAHVAQKRVGRAPGLDQGYCREGNQWRGAPDGWAWAEGGATALAEEVYDEASWANLWMHLDLSTYSLWQDQNKYRSNLFWRWLEWNKDAPPEDTVIGRVFAAVEADSAAEGQWLCPTDDHLNAVIDTRFSARTDYDRQDAFTDFAASWLYLHDFERDMDTGPPWTADCCDPLADALGTTSNEEGEGRLWHAWTDGSLPGAFDPSVDSASDLRGALELTAGSISELPISTSTDHDMQGGTARLLRLDLTAAMASEPTAITVEARGEPIDYVSDDEIRIIGKQYDFDAPRFHLRAYSKVDDERAQLIASVDDMAADEGAKIGISGDDAAAGEIFVVVAAAGHHKGHIEEVEIEVSVQKARLLIAGRGNGGGLLSVTTAGTSATLDDLGPSSLALLPTQTGARFAFTADRLPGEVLLTTDGGWLSAFTLLRGTEAEIDIDGDPDPDTTTEGAPEGSGLTRVLVGAGMRGVDLTSDGRWAITTSVDGLHVVDLDSFELAATISPEELDLIEPDRAYDVSLLPDDSRAYVSVYGAFNDASRTILSVDIIDVLAQLEAELPVVAPSVTAITTGGGANNTRIRVNPSGTLVAVAGTGSGNVTVIDTASDQIIDVAPDDPGRTQFNAPPNFDGSESPQWIEWTEDGTAIYVGYTAGQLQGSLGGHGVVRKCRLPPALGGPQDASGYCMHEVGVFGAVRSLGVTGSGRSRIIWVADDYGLLTPIEDYRFHPGATTSGRDRFGLFDGTGGCLEDPTGEALAIPCPDAGINLPVGPGGMSVVLE